MPIIQLIIILAVIGFLLWLLTTYVPMEPLIKRIIVIVVVFAVVIWLLNVFGLLNGLGTIKVHGQTREQLSGRLVTEPTVAAFPQASKAISCTVDTPSTEDQTGLIHCPDFDFKINSWPKAWEDYKSKGDIVRAVVRRDTIVAVAAPCKERIQKRYNQRIGLHPTLDSITPDDCRDIPAKDREKFTKELRK